MNARALNSARAPLAQAIHNDFLRLMVLGHQSAIEVPEVFVSTTAGGLHPK